MNFSSLLRVPFLCLFVLFTTHCKPKDGGTAQTDGKPAADGGSAQKAGEYVLCSDDVIRIEVAGEPALTTDCVIRQTGEVGLPLVGQVKIAGISVTAAAAQIRDLFKDYIENPKVALSVIAYAPPSITVIGAVNTPGHFALPHGGLNLADAIAACGGLTIAADPTRIILVRASGTSKTYDMATIKDASVGRVILEAGDRIIVNQSKVPAAP